MTASFNYARIIVAPLLLFPNGGKLFFLGGNVSLIIGKRASTLFSLLMSLLGTVSV